MIFLLTVMSHDLISFQVSNEVHVTKINFGATLCIKKTGKLAGKFPKIYFGHPNALILS